MSSPTDRLPALRVERWWGEHLRETRWQLELYRLLVDPVFRGRGVPRGEVRELTSFGICVLPFRDPDNIQLELTSPL